MERDAKQARLQPHELLQRRQAISRPLFDDIYAQLETWQTGLVRGSFLAKALTYLLDQNAKLSAVLDDARIPLSNVHVERLLKSVVLTRKKVCFADP